MCARRFAPADSGMCTVIEELGVWAWIFASRFHGQLDASVGTLQAHRITSGSMSLASIDPLDVLASKDYLPVTSAWIDPFEVFKYAGPSIVSTRMEPFELTILASSARRGT